MAYTSEDTHFHNVKKKKKKKEETINIHIMQRTYSCLKA